MIAIRPIDEELTRLHHPVITEDDDMDDNDVSLLRCGVVWLLQLSLTYARTVHDTPTRYIRMYSMHHLKHSI
jgi:hypothetical protein